MQLSKARRRRRRYVHPSQEGDTKEQVFPRIHWLLFLASILLFFSVAGIFLKDLSSQIAVSDARDIVTAEINRVVGKTMQQVVGDGEYFVRLEKNDRGEVIAISCDMAHINTLSAEILEQVIGSTENRSLTVEIPSGNLSGISLLMGKGPAIPVQIIMLTSSRVEFSNNILTAGINQTKHQISLQVIVDIDILIPWGSESTQVCTDILIADTMIVGQVPESYFHLQ